MRNFIVAVAVVLLAPSAAIAAPYSGPYIGIEGGVDNYKMGFDFDDGAGTAATFDGLGARGVAGGIFAGYQYPFGDAFASVEAFGGLSDATWTLAATDGINSYSFKAKAKESYGAAARLGMRLNTITGIYGRLGWVNTRFKGSVSDGIDTISDSYTQSAIQYGAGLETMVSRKMALRFEYVVADYGDADLIDGISLTNNAFRAGLSFRF